jgi:hypothetical protein
MLSSLIRFTLLYGVKVLVFVFYRCRRRFVGAVPTDFRDIRLAVLLNHTSLFEPMFSAMVPASLIWKIASNCVVPGADITMNRPVVGRFLKWLASDMITISRKRDESWAQFKAAIREDAIIIFLPEGRMKRPDGLDKFGQPMTVRKGIVEVLEMLHEGRMLFCYSGGLHHVQVPGQGFPKLFKTINMAFETIDIREYLAGFGALRGTPGYADAIAADMERRRDTWCGEPACT